MDLQNEKLLTIRAQVPPTNGWMIELGYRFSDSDDSFQSGYRSAYILGHPSPFRTLLTG